MRPFSIVAAAGLAAAIPATAAIPGAWELFDAEERTEVWTVYDYAEDEFYIPEWDQEGEYAYFFHLGDEPLWFFAGDQPGSGPLVGDYAAAGIQAVWCDAYIDDPEEFDFIDCAIYANGPAGERYYYSTPYYADDFDEAGWWSLRFGFDESWYYLDGDDFVEVAVTEDLLATVEEVGFRFFPRLGTTFDAIAAIDDVLLEPTVEAPATDVSVTDGQFRLAFDFEPGNAFDIQKLKLPALTWEDVTGQTDLRGTGTNVFSTPVDEQRKLFRVVAKPWYTPLE